MSNTDSVVRAFLDNRLKKNNPWLYEAIECGTQITALPDNLTVRGRLDLRGTQITALPDNLTVGVGYSGVIRRSVSVGFSNVFKLKG